MAAHCAFACARQRRAPELPTPLAAVCCAAATSEPGLRLAPVTTLHRDWAQAVVWVYPHTTASPQPLLHWGLAHPPTSVPGPADSHERLRRHARACVGAHTSARTRMRGCAYVGSVHARVRRLTVATAGCSHRWRRRGRASSTIRPTTKSSFRHGHSSDTSDAACDEQCCNARDASSNQHAATCSMGTVVLDRRAVAIAASFDHTAQSPALRPHRCRSSSPRRADS